MYPSDIFTRLYSDDEGDKLYPKEEQAVVEGADEVLETNIFNVMLNRRSQRKFDSRPVEESKMEMIFAAADTAPTAGGFQGFEIFHVKNQQVKQQLV